MAKLVRKKTSTKKAAAEKVEAPREPANKAEFIEQMLSKMLHEIDNYDFDGLNDREVRMHLGQIGQRYSTMSREFPDGVAVIGYKRVFKVMLLGQEPEAVARQRG